MKRVLIPVFLIVVAMGAALAWKLHAQETALTGPPGGSGVVEATSVNLSSRLAARIESVSVRRGDEVEQGQLLMELDCADARAMLAEAQARADASRAQAQAASANTDAAARNVAAARAAARSAGARVTALQSRSAVADREADRVESAGEYIAFSRRDQARAAADGLEREINAARASVSAGRQQAAAADAQRRAASAQASAAEVSVSAVEAAVQRAELLVAECRIVAPRDGFVDEVFFEAGELPRPGATLVRIVDLDEVTATFYLPNAEIGAVQTGHRAMVEADAFPGQTVEGEVITVSTEAEFTPRNIQTRTDRDRLVYAIEVRVQNRDSAIMLRPGMPVQVTLVGGAR